MIQTQQPNSILHPFLRNKDVRGLRLAQPHSKKRIIIIAVDLGSLEPVVALVPLCLTNLQETIEHR